MKVVGLALLLVSCWSTPRPAPPRSDARVDLKIERAELANGLRVVVVEEPSAGEVAITMRYGTGAVDDPVGREGLAHLVEHVLFEPVMDRLESDALAFNGFTTESSTLYVARTAPDRLAAMLEIEAARARVACDDVSTVAFTREREVVRNELRERESEDTVRATITAGVFGGAHPFARTATPATVAAITREDVCAFIANHYAPQNAVIVISGQTTLAAVRPLVDAAFGEVPRREIQAVKPVLAAIPHHLAVAAPVQHEWILIAWPLPADPVKRARLRAVAAMASEVVQKHDSGQISVIELGEGDASEISLAIAPEHDDTLDVARYGLTHTNSWFGSGLYEYAANHAIHDYLVTLDHGPDRDAMLADEVAAGRATDVVAPLTALHGMSRSEAHDLIDSALDLDKATVLTVHPSSVATKPVASLVTPFNEERARHPEDPQAAHVPATLVATPDPLAHVRRYALANGLNVVLAPLGSVPLVDVRLVFPTGTADEPAGKRGVAQLSADALESEFDPGALRFVQAGATINVDAALDHTAFAARGVASNLDLMLQGIDNIVRQGNYDTASRTVAALNASVGANRDTLIAEDAWRTAIYGANHPYFAAGVWRHANRLVTDDLVRFRASHYVPGGATLVVTGRFDPSDAEHWISYVFGDWRGATPARRLEPIHLQPLAFSLTRPGSQLGMVFAFAAPANPAIAEVVAEMLDEASADVRDALAASYGIHAGLSPHRAGSTLLLGGAADANRAGEVAKLLRDRLARLAGDEMLFVAARRHVIAKLRSIDLTTSGLADRFVEDTDVPRPTAAEVARVTLEQLAPALAAIDVDRAAMLLSGPAPAIAAAATAFGRTLTPLN